MNKILKNNLKFYQTWKKLKYVENESLIVFQNDYFWFNPFYLAKFQQKLKEKRIPEKKRILIFN